MPSPAPARSVLARLAGLSAPSIACAALLIAARSGIHLLLAGITFAPDSRTYAYWSQRLLDSGFDYSVIVGEAKTEFPALLYALFGTLLAVLKWLFGDGWAVALVALNFAASIALGLLVVRLSVRLTKSGVAAWAALILYLGCLDLLRWVPFVLSDATFVLLAFTIFWLAAARILGDSRGWAPVLAPAAAVIFYRPTGMVLLPDLGWAIYLSRGRRLPRRGAAIAGAATLVAAVLCATVVFVWIMQDPGRWPFRALAGVFESVARGYAIGEVVSARPETHHAPPQALIDFLLISADRLVHFFAIGAADFSAGHWLANFAFFLPCYGLAGWFVLALARGDTGLADGERRVFLAAIGAVLAYALFHALVQIDFDWRYRVPVLPHLILLAAGGAADLARRANAR